MMGDGTTVSITPMEWRSRLSVVAQARPVVFHEHDIGKRLLLLREQLSDGGVAVRRRIKALVELGRSVVG